MQNFTPIPNYPKYLINQDGQIYSTISQRLLRPTKTAKGYYGVELHSKWAAVHRLVAITFLTNSDNLPQVNHKDEDKSNNKLENLEWCSNQYNADYSFSKIHKFIDPNGEIVTIKNLAAWCREHNFNNSNFCNLAKGKIKSYKKYTRFQESSLDIHEFLSEA